MIVTCREPLQTPGAPVARFDVQKPTRPEQVELWRAALSRHARTAAEDLSLKLESVVTHFDFGPTMIGATADIVLGAAAPDDGDSALAARLWEGCRAQARGRLDDLAQRIATPAGWDELVLPDLNVRTTDVYFTYPEELRHSKRIAVFRDFLLRKVAETRF